MSTAIINAELYALFFLISLDAAWWKTSAVKVKEAEAASNLG